MILVFGFYFFLIGLYLVSFTIFVKSEFYQKVKFIEEKEPEKKIKYFEALGIVKSEIFGIIMSCMLFYATASGIQYQLHVNLNLQASGKNNEPKNLDKRSKSNQRSFRSFWKMAWRFENSPGFDKIFLLHFSSFNWNIFYFLPF